MIRVSAVASLLALSLTLTACDSDDGAGTAWDGGLGDGAAPGSDAALAACSALRATTSISDDVNISTSQTWSGVVSVKGAVIVSNGAKITIAPGTVVVMAAGSSIEFGWNSHPTTVLAQGTAAAPIRFCGAQPKPGFYSTIKLSASVTTDSVLSHVIVSEGGSGGVPSLQLGAAADVTNVTVTNAAGDGVLAANFAAGSTNLSVTDVAGVPVALSGPQAATNFPLGGVFARNVTNVVAVRFESIDVDTIFRNTGIPYLQEQNIITRRSKTTFEAGVNYTIAVDRGIEFAWNSNTASVFALGTATAPVIFDRSAPAAGRWTSLLLGPKVTTDSKFQNVIIRGGGGKNQAALDISSAVTLDSVTLEQNATTALKVGDSGLSPTSANLKITGTEGPAAIIAPNTLITMPKGGTFTGNTKDHIVVIAGNYELSGTVPNLGVPFRIEGNLLTRTDSKMNIEAGTVFVMGPDSSIEFGWNSNVSEIVAVGTNAAPIVFKGGDDVPGYWNGILMRSNVLSTSKFDFVQILNGGKSTSAGLTLSVANFKLTNSTISKSSGWGIIRAAGDTTDYRIVGMNMLTGNLQGDLK